MAEDKIKLGNNNEIAYSQLNSNIKKDDIGAEKLRLLFDFFDSDNNGVLDSSEINEIWKTIKSEAGKNGNSIFETEEAEQFLQNNNDKNSVKLFSKNINATDLFSFLKVLAPQKAISESSAATGGGANPRQH